MNYISILTIKEVLRKKSVIVLAPGNMAFLSKNGYLLLHPSEEWLLSPPWVEGNPCAWYSWHSWQLLTPDSPTRAEARAGSGCSTASCLSGTIRTRVQGGDNIPDTLKALARAERCCSSQGPGIPMGHCRLGTRWSFVSCTYAGSRNSGQVRRCLGSSNHKQVPDLPLPVGKLLLQSQGTKA